MTEVSRHRYLKSILVFRDLTAINTSMEVDLTVDAKAWVCLIKETFPNAKLSSLAYAYRSYAHLCATIDWFDTYKVEQISTAFSEAGQGLELKLLSDCDRKALISRLDAAGFAREGTIRIHCTFQGDLVNLRLAWCGSVEQYDRLTNLALHSVFPVRRGTLIKQQSQVVSRLNEVLGGSQESLDLFELLVDRL